MKKTLFASFFFPPENGGIQTYISSLINELPPEKVVVLAKNHPEAHIYDPQQKYTVYRTAFDSVLKYVKLSNISFYQELKHIVQKEAIEHIVLAHPLPLGISASFLKSRLNIPFSTFTHGTEITQALQSSFQKKALQKTLTDAQHVFCTTEYMKKLLITETNVDKKSIHIIPPGISPNTKKMSKKTLKKYNLDKTKNILTVARLVKRKGHDIAIQALPEILNEEPNAHYIIVGKGPEKENLEKQARDLNILNHVSFLENISDTELADLYAGAHVFAMPSKVIDQDIEGFGIVFLEAAQYGIPSIATKTGGIPEAVLHNKTGILLGKPPKKITKKYTQTFVDACISLLKDTKNTLGKAAKKRALTEFRWSIQAKKLKTYL